MTRTKLERLRCHPNQEIPEQVTFRVHQDFLLPTQYTHNLTLCFALYQIISLQLDSKQYVYSVFFNHFGSANALHMVCPPKVSMLET